MPTIFIPPPPPRGNIPHLGGNKKTPLMSGVIFGVTIYVTYNVIRHFCRETRDATRETRHENTPHQRGSVPPNLDGSNHPLARGESIHANIMPNRFRQTVQTRYCGPKETRPQNIVLSSFRLTDADRIHGNQETKNETKQHYDISKVFPLATDSPNGIMGA